MMGLVFGNIPEIRMMFPQVKPDLLQEGFQKHFVIAANDVINQVENM